MRKLSFTLLILFAFSANVTAQSRATDIFWSPDRQIHFSDYQSELNDGCLWYMETFATQTFANIDFRWVVDVPRRWRGRNAGKIDRGYVVPVFCRECSCILSKDSLSLKVDHLLFDVAEAFARNIRRDLNAFQREMNIRNPNSMFFISVKSREADEMRRFAMQILRDIFVDKIEDAYENWRKVVNKSLEQSITLATTDEDRRRFITGRPIEGYIEARRIIGDLRSRENTNE